MWGRVVSCVYVKAWPCHSCLFTSLASISTAFLFSHCQCWIVTGSSIVFTKLPCVTPTTGARQTFRVGWHLALADLFLCTGKNVSVHVSFPVTVCWVLHAQVFGRGRFVDLEVEALFFFFSFAESEKCGSPKIHVCTEDRLLPPMFLAQEKTSAGLSILRQLHIRMSVHPCRFLMRSALGLKLFWEIRLGCVNQHCCPPRPPEMAVSAAVE